MYQMNGTAPIPPQTSTALSAAPTPTGGPVAVQSAGPYIYYGCWIDNTNGQRALSASENPEYGSGNTVEACAAACAGYTYMGVEYGAECYCDNVIEGGNVIAPGGNDPTQNGCSMVRMIENSLISGLTLHDRHVTGTLLNIAEALTA